VLAKVGALVDLIAAGARLIEPDHRVTSGEIYPPPDTGLSLRTFDQEPGLPKAQRFVVASAETLAFAVASGQVGDPRNFKRPVRVTVPRALPTDDVLVVRKTKSKGKGEGPDRASASEASTADRSWKGGATLPLIREARAPAVPSALLLGTLDEVRWAADRAPSLAPNLRAVIAPFIPSGTAPLFAGLGILALTGDEATLARLVDATSIDVPDPRSCVATGLVHVVATGQKVELRWAAVGAEREWTAAGTARTSAAST
jgi:aconitate hydratase